MANETYELIPSGTLSGQFVQNVLHLTVDNTAATPPFVVATAILTKFNGASQFISKWCDMLPDSYSMSSLRCRRILPDGGPTDILLQGAMGTSTGARSGAESTSSACPLLIWLSTLRPSKTGRTFLPGASEDDLDQNVIQSGLLAAMVAFGAYWHNGGTLTSPAYTWGGSIYRRAIAAADDITSVRVSPIIGVQRRRQRPI